MCACLERVSASVLYEGTESPPPSVCACRRGSSLLVLLDCRSDPANMCGFAVSGAAERTQAILCLTQRDVMVNKCLGSAAAEREDVSNIARFLARPHLRT